MGREFVYHPVRPRHRAGQLAIRHVLDVFFDGSLEKAIALHLADPATNLDPDQRARLTELFRDSGNEGP